MIMQRHCDGSDGARPEHGVLVHRDYGLMASEGLAGNLSTTGFQGSRDNPKDTTETGDTNGMKMEIWDQNRHHAPSPAHIQPE